jgi:hypothetical protein
MVGVATVYTGPVGAPLYCDRWDTEWHYDAATGPWVAVDVGEYESGRVQCGDWLELVFTDGARLRARALDAGRLRGYYVEDWGADRPIVVDVPREWAPFEGLSAPVQVEVPPYESRGAGD